MIRCWGRFDRFYSIEIVILLNKNHPIFDAFEELLLKWLSITYKFAKTNF